MLLAALHRLITEMRRSHDASGDVSRGQMAMLNLGLNRADLLYPTVAANIRDDDAGCRTMLDVAAKAIVEQTTFVAAWETMSPSYTLSPQILAFFEGALASPLPES